MSPATMEMLLVSPNETDPSLFEEQKPREEPIEPSEMPFNTLEGELGFKLLKPQDSGFELTSTHKVASMTKSYGNFTPGAQTEWTHDDGRTMVLVQHMIESSERPKYYAYHDIVNAYQTELHAGLATVVIPPRGTNLAFVDWVETNTFIRIIFFWHPRPEEVEKLLEDFVT